MVRTVLFFSILVLFTASCTTSETGNSGPDSRAVNEVAFFTDDSVELHADLYIRDSAQPFIMLYHQGGSNVRGEYRDIIPELLNRGYNIMATDLRSGGQAYGSWNRTIAAFPLNPYGYCDALEDVRSSIKFIRASGFQNGILLWGSSYSAALVIRMAAEQPVGIAGVLAFSPASGESLADCDPNAVFEGFPVPILVLRPSGELDYPHVRAQFELARASGIEVYEAGNGVHGSSMLVQERVKGPVDAHWKAVNDFLDSLRDR